MSALSIKEDSPGITDVPGFTAAGAGCDVRETGAPRKDIALIYSQTACSAAGVFTTNDVKAAPVLYCQDILQAQSQFNGIIANSGNANACTGQQGKQDTLAMATATAKALKEKPENFFVCSTGRIGRKLPIENLLKGIDSVCSDKGNSPQHGQDAADAILTSDTRSKTVTVQFEWEGQTVTISGIAKGAGMIEPNMATMLAFIATDACVSKETLQKVLTKANQQAFNAITVDGDMSTNDTVLMLANGLSGIPIFEEMPELFETFQKAVTEVCKSLARKIVGDGEKVTKLVTINIQGASTEAAAEKVARAIGNSLLVKTSWYGSDPNWGRIMDAAGYARVGLIEEKVDLAYNSCAVLESGTPLDKNLDQWKAIVSEPEFTINLNLNLGDAHYQLLSSDLSEAYVDFNKSE